MNGGDHSKEREAARTGLRIAITGTGGRLGGALRRIYSEHHDVTAFDRGSLDLADGDRLREVLNATAFDALINPAAMTSVDQCQEQSELAWAVNAEAPKIMANVCREKGVRFVHVSTDYVFDGRAPGLRKEDDPCNPLGIYGETKRAGEVGVLEADSSALVVRTSWVFGPERPAFPDSIVQRALVGERVEAIADKWSAPTYADDFARYLEPLLEPGSAAGILHLCNSGSCNWQEYGQAALDCALAGGLPLKTQTVEPLLLEDMKQFAVPRPVHTAMDTAHFRDLGFGIPRPWQDALSEYLENEIRAGKFSGF